MHLLCIKLTACGNDFLEIGKNEWMLNEDLKFEPSVSGQRIEAPGSGEPDADDEYEPDADDADGEFTTKVQSNSEKN